MMDAFNGMDDFKQADDMLKLQKYCPSGMTLTPLWDSLEKNLLQFIVIGLRYLKT